MRRRLDHGRLLWPYRAHHPVTFAFFAFAFLASAAALLAFLALAARCSAVIVSRDRLPPMRPPFAPCSLKNLRTSGGSFFTARTS